MATPAPSPPTDGACSTQANPLGTCHLLPWTHSTRSFMLVHTMFNGAHESHRIELPPAAPGTRHHGGEATLAYLTELCRAAIPDPHCRLLLHHKLARLSQGGPGPPTKAHVSFGHSPPLTEHDALELMSCEHPPTLVFRFYPELVPYPRPLHILRTDVMRMIDLDTPRPPPDGANQPPELFALIEEVGRAFGESVHSLFRYSGFMLFFTPSGTPAPNHADLSDAIHPTQLRKLGLQRIVTDQDARRFRLDAAQAPLLLLSGAYGPRSSQSPPWDGTQEVRFLPTRKRRACELGHPPLTRPRSW